MTQSNLAQQALAKLNLPAQDIDFLTFCSGSKANKVAAWAEQLKVAQTLNTCAQLYQAIPQVLRLETGILERKTMLDHLMQVAYPCVEQLGKEFLNQPLALPDKAQKAAVIGQSILNNLSQGYLLFLRALSGEKRLKPAALDAAQEAIVNGLHCLALMQLRSQQLYSQAAPIIWRQAYCYVLVAERLELLHKAYSPKVNSLAPGSAWQGFVRMVAMANANSNQLTQVDMGHTFKVLPRWAEFIQASDTPSNFWLDLTSDKPAQKYSRQPPSELDTLLHLDFQPLIQQLQETLQQGLGARKSHLVPTEITSTTLSHLIAAWHQDASRSNDRLDSQHNAELIVGFSQCHKQLSSLTLDPDTVDQEELNTIATLQVTTQNVSKGGYCFQWDGQQAARIDAGDLVLVREHARRGWSLGVIRWIRKLKSCSRFGIQLLSHKPAAVTACCAYENGGYSDKMRAFHLPQFMPGQAQNDETQLEAQTINSAPQEALITGNVLFREHADIQWCKLTQDHNHQDILEHCLMTTGKVQVFSLGAKPGAENAPSF